MNLRLRDAGRGARRTSRAVAAWLRLLRLVGRQNAAHARRLRRQGMTLAQFDVIAQVGPAAGITQHELAERLVVTAGNVTQLLQKMERQGWVTRVQSGRCNRLELTARGRGLRRKLVPGQEAAIVEIFAPLDDAELETLSRLLRKIQHSGS